jgi:hypothetical protein
MMAEVRITQSGGIPVVKRVDTAKGRDTTNNRRIVAHARVKTFDHRSRRQESPPVTV